MRFIRLARLFEQLEKTASSNAMQRILASFFKKVSTADIDKVCYLTLGRITSLYDNVVLGVADQMVVKSIASAVKKDELAIKEDFKKLGDLGNVAEKDVRNKKPSLSVKDVFSGLNNIAVTTGSGSQQKKITILASLLRRATAIEAKYIVRITLGTLRMGVADMTVLSALTIAFTDGKANKKIIEHAYTVCPDVGIIALTLATKKIQGIKKIKPVIGRPIKVMLAQRVKSLLELEKRMPHGIIAEEKYDGERVQIHKKGKELIFFSRRMEDITKQFPDVVKALRKIKKDFIAEAEIMPIDNKGKLLDFQTLMKRKRKHDIEMYVKNIPVVLFFFDLLYLNKSYLDVPFAQREKVLRSLFKSNDMLKYARNISTKSSAEVESFFMKCIEQGSEGIIAKSVTGSYQAGTRGYNWIKWKKDYVKALRDSFDLVVIGAISGKGKRAGSYGALLCAVYNKKRDCFESFCKLGTGFTDAQLEHLPQKLAKYRVNKKPTRVVAWMKVDEWFQPEVVVEVIGAEITKSPLHTAGEHNKKGLALRFPRFVRFRSDKKAEQATTVEEILKIK